mmetsp:Transcript_17304/g.60467  ORF Transcript_17304/g.60467 Transcript_17304/m.60467 type:complete len:221 (-) Transcript_17304:541-1203(-)
MSEVSTAPWPCLFCARLLGKGVLRPCSWLLRTTAKVEIAHVLFMPSHTWGRHGIPWYTPSMPTLGVHIDCEMWKGLGCVFCCLLRPALGRPRAKRPSCWAPLMGVGHAGVGGVAPWPCACAWAAAWMMQISWQQQARRCVQTVAAPLASAPKPAGCSEPQRPKEVRVAFGSPLSGSCASSVATTRRRRRCWGDYGAGRGCDTTTIRQCIKSQLSLVSCSP